MNIIFMGLYSSFNNIHTTKIMTERASIFFGAGYYKIHPV